MADLEQALDRLLGDPAAMAQIMDLAGKLNGQAGSEGADPAAESPEAGPDVPAPEFSPGPGELAPLLALLQGGGGGDPRAAELLRALRPFLSASRQRKLDKAVRLSSLARTAREALRLWKEGELSV